MNHNSKTTRASSAEQTRAKVNSALRTDKAGAYERPAIISHSGEDILEELGPAQACYPFNSCGISP